MPKVKIYGNPNPEVGVKEYYSIHDLFGNSSPQFVMPQFQNLSDEQVKWSIWVYERDKWIKKSANNKTGATVDYTFYHKSLSRKAIRMLVDANGEKAVLNIKTQKTSHAKILNVELLDANYNKPARPFVYGDWIIARVYCVDMELMPVTVSLWEDDGDKTKQNSTNVKIETKKGAVKNGKADVAFYLDPSHTWLANAKLAKGDKNEGETHEYYVTAEIFEKVSKRVPSKNANVPNPDYKPEPPKPKHPIPAEQKGPSKKDQKGIAKSEHKVHDYHEKKVAVKNEISTNPIWEMINSYATVWMPDKKDEKKAKNCICKEYDLIWGNRVSCDFRKKVVEISKRLGKDPNLLMAAMALETGRTFSPTAGKGTSYIGLIQFGDTAAESIDTTTDALLKMTALQQLDYVEKYLTKNKSRLATLVDFYLSILMPVDVGKGSTPNHVVFDNKYNLEYKKDGKTLTDLSKSRHYGYRQNPSFFYETGEKEKVIKEGGKKYDGEGKTYIWEIEKYVNEYFSNGKNNKANVFTCDKNTVIKSDVESGTWNVVITEKYTGKKCTHDRKQRANCRRGIIEIFDHNKKLALTISDCLLEGWKGEDRTKNSNDTPFGTYNISNTPFKSGGDRIAYGPNPRLVFEPINGSGDEVDKSGRSEIRIHGGRQEQKGTYLPLENPKLLRTSGCIRVLDSDAKRIYDWWVKYHKINPSIKPGKVKIVK